MIILFIFLPFNFSSTHERQAICFLMYIYICEIFVSIYLYLKIFKILPFLKKKTYFFILWTWWSCTLIITKKQLTIEDPAADTTGRISHAAFVSLMSGRPESAGWVYSEQSASSWPPPFIQINQL